MRNHGVYPADVAIKGGRIAAVGDVATPRVKNAHD